MKILSIAPLILLLQISCTRHKIEITNSYVINGNWDKQANLIEVTWLKLRKDSLVNPFLSPSQNELLTKLVEDSSFIFFGNVKFNGEDYESRKVYFARDNGFTWYSPGGKIRKTTIGNLKSDRWYKISGMHTYPVFYYLFIDSVENTYKFEINMANF